MALQNIVKILITGASGGLGGALARELARSGVHLVLWGRDRSRLAAVGKACEALGAQVSLHAADLSEMDQAVAALLGQDDDAPFDMAFLVAGRGDVRERGALCETPGIVTALGIVNFVAPAAMAAALAERMAQRGRGRIVLIGSAAAFHALPFAAAYAGSKAGLARFAEALRIAVKPHGVTVTLASPGFIDTETARALPGKRPFSISPQEAARRIVGAAERGQAHLITPRAFAGLRLLDRALPRPLRERLLRALAPPGW